MAQDHGLCRKKVRGVNKWTGARAATAGPCCSCQRDSLAACKHAGPDDKLLALTDPGAHGNEQVANKARWNGRGQSKLEANERGQELDEGQWVWQAKWQAGKQSLLNKATAGGHSRWTLRPAQAS